MVLACRRDHRFAKLKKFDVQQLAEETLVGFDTDLVIWKKIDRFLKDRGVEANVMVRFDNIEAIKRAVEAGSGVALLPRRPAMVLRAKAATPSASICASQSFAAAAATVGGVTPTTERAKPGSRAASCNTIEPPLFAPTRCARDAPR